MIFTSYSNDFWHKRKVNNFDPYNVLLTIATNISVPLMTGFVVHGHIYAYHCLIGLQSSVQCSVTVTGALKVLAKNSINGSYMSLYWLILSRSDRQTSEF